MLFHLRDAQAFEHSQQIARLDRWLLIIFKVIDHHCAPEDFAGLVAASVLNRFIDFDKDLLFYLILEQSPSFPNVCIKQRDEFLVADLTVRTWFHHLGEVVDLIVLDSNV